MQKETELKLSEELIPLLDSGEKRITIRFGHRDFEDRITIAGRPVIVESVEHYQLMDIPFQPLIDDGFLSFGHTFRKLQKFYPEIRSDSPFTVIRYSLAPQLELDA